MKKCPFCKAEIEENARFCLYCMKPLAEKEVVSPVREKRQLIWLLPFLTIFLILGVLAAILLLGNPRSDPPMADTTAPITVTDPENPSAPEETVSPTVTDPTEESEPPAEDDPTQGTEPPVEDDPTPPVTEDPPCTHNYLLQTEEKPTCTQGGSRYLVCSECEDVKVEKSPASGHRFNDATCELPKTCMVCQVTEGSALGHSYKDNTCMRCGDKQATDTEPDVNPGVSYQYHLAEAEDLGLSSYQHENNDIVITGVCGENPTGEYTIPSYIDGKRVVAIMPDAFMGTNATKVMLGSTIQIIRPYAFSDCADLTDIYFSGEYLNVWPNAFPYTNSLQKPLTIHCSATCHDAEMRLYKNMANINWEEWNGEL